MQHLFLETVKSLFRSYAKQAVVSKHIHNLALQDGPISVLLITAIMFFSVGRPERHLAEALCRELHRQGVQH